ncbi:MAG: glycosyltransferase [Pseudomonadota bacterium]
MTASSARLDHRTARRPRVLVLAEAANPDWVSVPLVGWSLAHALREVADVHLVTQVRNRDAILGAGYRDGEDVTFIDNEAFAARAQRLSSRLGGGRGVGWTVNQAIGSLAYPQFERLAWQRFASEIAAGSFDLVHRVTPVSPTLFGPFGTRAAAKGVPFVIGPLNGGVPWPPAFDAERRREREWLSYVRSGYKLLPGRAASLKSAAAILAGSRHTAREIPRRHRDRTLWLPENAIDPDRFDLNAPRRRAPGPLRAAFIGRLVPYKGPDMALEAALPLLEAGRMTLDIVGDGPLAVPLEGRVAEAGVGDRVTLHGWRDHREIQSVLGRADILAFPSIREFGGGVVLEAMALGTVPIVVDYGGPGELVTAETGIALALGPRADIVARLRAALETAAAAPEALAPMSQAGRALVRAHFTWEAKARQIADVYAWVLGHRASRPDFALPVSGASA